MKQAAIRVLDESQPVDEIDLALQPQQDPLTHIRDHIGAVPEL